MSETIGCEAAERCRNKAEYALEMQGGRLRAGYFEARSHRVLPVEDCRLQRTESVRALNWIQAHLAEHACAGHIRGLVTRVNRAGEMMVVLCGDAPVQEGVNAVAQKMQADLPELKSVFFCRLKARPTHALDGVCSHVAGAQTLCDELLGLKFELSPQSFFQVNPVQTEALYRKALEAAGAGKGCRLLDAYCGAGTITLAAAQLGAQALGVEIVAPAIENARRNARRNGYEGRVRFVCADAAREIPRRIAAGERFAAAVLDPPRKGADPQLLEALAGAEIPRVAYVSCNPSTLARDVKILSARGYRLEWAQPVDMFPWTEHVETVVLLSKLNVDHHIEVELKMDELDLTAAESKATYEMCIRDRAYIGMLNSDVSLAAVGVTLPLLLIMVSIENIFAAGASVLAGRQLGAGDRDGASRTVTTIAGFSMLVGLALCVLGILFIEPLLRAFGASDAVLPQAKDYAFWMFIAALFNLPAQSLNCAARAESSVKISDRKSVV